MAIRDIDRRLRNLDSSDTTTPTPLTDSLINNDEFTYAHLVKFEKPTNDMVKGRTSQKANTFSYITDSAFDISWDDFSNDAQGNANGTQTYHANKLLKTGSVTETVEAKASSMSLVLDSSSLGAEVTFAGIAITSTTVLCQLGVDLPEEGFREGDKVHITTSNGSYGNGYVIINEFQDNGRKFTYTSAGTITLGTDDATNFYTISLASEEIHALILNKEATHYTTYLNREVFVYKAHLDPDTNVMIGDPYLLFKGIISGGSIKENPDKNSTVTWTLSSHWGDFSRVSGRLTVDDSHRALDGNGQPDEDALIRPEYASDEGFAHANQSLNVMALYNDIEISYKQVDINGGWFGGKRLKEIETEVEKRVDISFNLSPKYLPVVYGVQKLDSIPIFVDTDNTDASQIYVAYAICEGPVAGLLDIYVGDNSSICVDKADFDLRSTAGDTVEFVCKGRMDRGDALTGYSAGSGNFNLGIDREQSWIQFGEAMRGGMGGSTFRSGRTQTQTYSANATVADSATGILHEGTHTITSPLKGHFQFHAGKPLQRANSTLVNKAAARGFKIQNDYFDGEGDYWGSQHQLLDTAYVVGKFTIAAGETSIPELDFVIRGKGIKCYNYDRSYNNTNAIVYTSANKTNFNLGDTVTLKRASNDATISSATIIDKWDLLDGNGVTQTRFRTDYDTDIVNTHYMLSASGGHKWYMSPDDKADDITSLVTTPSKTTISSSSANSGGDGIDVVVDYSAVFTAAITAALAEANGVIAFSGALRRELESSEFYNIHWNANTNTLEGVGSGTEVTSLDDTITEVFVKDAIILHTDDSEADGYYNGKTIILTRFNSDGVPKIQEKIITSYVSTGNAAVVDSPWEAGYFPDSGDTYTISASKPDVRVSINPAMQMLDYLTSKRYGRGLDIDLDIDLATFKESARLCDTRSNITVAVPNAESVSVGAVYKYAPSDVMHFQGTVESVTTRIQDSTTYKEVVFKDVIGKLGHKFNTWESVRINELIWHSSGNLYKTQAAGGYALTAAHIITALDLTKVSGSGETTLALNVSLLSDNGNPLVKSWVPFSAGDTNGSFIGSGYTLYDSDNIKYWKYIGWDSNGQRNVTRHQMNQTVVTSSPIFDNVNLMLKQFNGILRYSNGKYQLDIRGKSPDTFVVGEVLEEADIIGTISIKDKGVKKSYNSVSASIKDPATKFESRSVSFFNSTYLKQDKSVPKKGNYGTPGITNYFNARFNINQMLDESRYGLTVSFKMMPKGMLLLPGSIIRLNYPRFGWVNKEFRISSLITGVDCLVNVTADEHNNDAFLIKSITEPAVGGTIATGSIQNKNRPSSPSSLASTFNDKTGHIKLTWTNSTEFDTTNSYTEIHSSTTNNIATATLLSTISDGTASSVVAIGATGTSDTVYYWVRHTKVYTTAAGVADRTVVSLFHPNGTTGISGAEVPRYPIQWNIRVSTLPTSSSLAQTRWGDGTGNQPDTPITGDQAWFNTGTAENPTTQKIWLYGGSGWTEQTAAVAGNLLVDNTVTVTEIDTTSATGGTFGAVVAAIDSASFSTVDTDVLNANSVIAREVQVFPVGGTAPTISGTTLAGAGIDLKQDGDLYVGNYSTNKYMFWDQSAGVMTFRGTLNAGDLTAGTITADRIAVGSLDADKITANTITASEIAADAITTDLLAAGAITATEIATNAITADKVAADAITATKIDVANLSSLNANLGAVTAGTIKGGSMPDADAAPSGAETGAFLDLAAGKMVLGNASKYIHWSGSALTISGVTLNAANITNSSGSFTTQSDVNSSITTAVNALIDSAPDTLNTLNELAAALDDDDDFHTAVTASLTAKLPKAGGAMTGAITTNSTFDGRNVSVDGTKLDGIAANATATSVPYYTSAIPNATASATGLATNTQITKLDGIAASANYITNNNQISNGAGYLTSADDGDAATFGGVAPSGYVTTGHVQALHATDAISVSGRTVTLRKGSNATETITTQDTTYSVGDGGLTQNNFTNADHTKLNAIEASADVTDTTNVVAALTAGTNVTISAGGTIASTDTNTTYSVGDGGLTQKNFTTTLKNKLDGIATSANNYGHPSDGVDMGAALTGANVLSDVTVNALGHVTGFATRALTLANLSYTGDSDATNGATSAQATAIASNTTIANAALPKAGGTMTGTLTMGSNAISSTGAITATSAVFATSGTSYSSGTVGLIVKDTSNRGTIRIRSDADQAAELFFDVNGAIRWDISTRTSGESYDLNFYAQAATPALNNVSAPPFTVKQNGTINVKTGITLNGTTAINSSRNFFAASSLKVSAVAPQNIAPSSNEIEVSGYGIVGNRGTFYITNSGVVQLGTGSIHNGSPAFTAAGTYVNVGASRTFQMNGTTVIDASRNLTNIGSITTTGTVNGRNMTTDGDKLDDIHADLLNVSSSGSGALDLELLKADTIIANHITANTIDASHLKVSNNAAGSAGIYMDGTNNRIDIRDASVLRVRIGYLGS